MTKRLSWLDILRAFGVIGVVVYHSGAPSWLLALIVPWFYSVFFFVSGYTYKDEYTRQPWILAKKRFFTLYLPLIGWHFAYFVLHNLFLRLHIISDQGGTGIPLNRPYGPADILPASGRILTMRGGEDMAGPLWFVVALITVTAVFCLISVVNRWLFRDAEPTRLAMVLAVMAIGLTNQSVITYPPALNFALLCTGFFYAGYLYKRYEAKVPAGVWVSVVAAGVLIAARGTYGVWLPLEAARVLPTMLAALAGVYLGVMAAKAMGSSGPLEFIGRNSLTIIALHFLAFKLVSEIIVLSRHLPVDALATLPVITGEPLWWLAYSIVGLLVPYALKRAYDRLRGRLHLRGAVS